MSKKEVYIGIPNGVVLCIDEPMRHGLLRARLYHGYHREGLEVASFDEIIRLMGRMFDEIQFPRASIRERSFTERKRPVRPFRGRRERIMTDKELLSKHGDIGTFIIRVQQRQNSTWQGRITWVDEDKTMNFRSLLEMVKLIESGLLSEFPELREENTPTWDKE